MEGRPVIYALFKNVFHQHPADSHESNQINSMAQADSFNSGVLCSNN